jgi:hypothetical protein
VVTICTTSLTFSNSTFCPHIVFMFCVDLRTNSDYFPIQHLLTGFYNWDKVCLLRGTTECLCVCVCIYISGSLYSVKDWWPRGLRRGSSAAWFLVFRVRIPLRAWIFVCWLCFDYVAASATSWSVGQRSSTGCVCVCVCNCLWRKPQQWCCQSLVGL